MGQRQRKFHILAHRYAVCFRFCPINRNRQIGGPGHVFRDGALIFDAYGQHHLFAQYPEGGGVLDDQAAVPICRVPGQQNMQRGRHCGGQGQVMDLTVSDDDRPCHPGARFFGQRFGKGGHGLRAAITRRIAKADHAQFRVVQRRDFGLNGRQRLGHLGGAVTDRLAGAFIDNSDHDITQGRAILFLQGRVCKGGQQHRRRQPAQPPSGQAPPCGKTHEQQGKGRQGRQHGQWDQRIKDERSCHCPNLSSRAGTCT